MKKEIRLIVPLLATVLLVACQQNETAKNSKKEQASSALSSTSQSSSASSTSSSQLEKQREPEEAYATVLEQEKAEDSTASKRYVFYDIDKNGSKELLVGYVANGAYHLGSIYYLKDGEATLVGRSYVASAGGHREAVSLYTDGTIFHSSWHALSPDARGVLYRLKADNSTAEVVKEADFQIAGVAADSELSANQVFGLQDKEVFNLSTLDWKNLADDSQVSDSPLLPESSSKERDRLQSGTEKSGKKESR